MFEEDPFFVSNYHVHFMEDSLYTENPTGFSFRK